MMKEKRRHKAKRNSRGKKKNGLVTISALPDAMWRTIAMKKLPTISNEWEIIKVAMST